MIKCDIVRKNGMVAEFTITGHAGAGEEGEDIVCAGVSSVVYGAIGAIEDMFHIMPFEDSKEPDDDYLKFVLPEQYIPQDDATNIKIGAILDAMVIGLKQLELGYGKYVKVFDGGKENVKV